MCLHSCSSAPTRSAPGNVVSAACREAVIVPMIVFHNVGARNGSERRSLSTPATLRFERLVKLPHFAI
jgi:hypothetical protein